MLAIVILVLPFVLEAILSSILQSESDIVNSIKGSVTEEGSYTLGPTNYGAYSLPYYILNNSDPGMASFQSYLNNLYQTSRPGITLEPVYSSNSSLNAASSVVNDYGK